MSYPELKKLKDELLRKQSRNADEEALLDELLSLSNIIDKADFSLAKSSSVCSACGRPFK